MSVLAVKSLMDDFERSAAEARRRKMLLREEFMFEADEQKREQRKKLEEEEREFQEQLDAVLATSTQLADFNGRLERYDTATVEALMDNQQALDRVHERLERIHAEAYVLPDGRRVFATAKRDAVFDESGARVGRDVLEPAAIPRSKPTWEEQEAIQKDAKRLDSERSELLAFQAKLDVAHERVAQGGLSKKDLDDLDAELTASMPASVAGHMPQDRVRATVASPASPSDEASGGLFGVKVPVKSFPRINPDFIL